MRLRHLAELGLALLLVLGMVLGLSLLIASLVEVRFSVGGPMSPLMPGHTYVFEGRPRREDPPVVIRITLMAGQGTWPQAKVEISNFLSFKIKVELSIYIYGPVTPTSGPAGVVIAEAHGEAEVGPNKGQPGETTLVLELSWAEGWGPKDAVWGKLDAEVRGRPGISLLGLSSIALSSSSAISLRKMRQTATSTSA